MYRVVSFDSCPSEAGSVPVNELKEMSRCDGSTEGITIGSTLGIWVGTSLGACDGDKLGDSEGEGVGAVLGRR